MGLAGVLRKPELFLLPLIISAGAVACGIGVDTLSVGGSCALTPGVFGSLNLVLGSTTGAAGGTGSKTWDQGQSVVEDAQGRFWVSGFSANNLGTRGFVLAVWRYNPDGSPDTSFGNGGIAVSGTVSLSGGTGIDFNDQGVADQLDAQGRLVVAGFSIKSGGGRQMALLRFTSTGLLDSSFGNQGVVLSGTTGALGGAGSAEDDEATALAFDGQGRIIVSGFSAMSVGVYQQVIWRYNSDGTLDTSFGTGGIASSGTTGAAGGVGAKLRDVGNAMQIDSQGRIVVTGYSQKNSNGVFEQVIWRYSSSGFLDPAFGNSGVALSGTIGAAGASAGAENDVGSALQIDAQGRAVVAGFSKNASGGLQFALWRYNVDGSHDLSLGSNGSVVLASATGLSSANVNDAPTSLQIDTQGRLIVAGYSSSQPGKVGDELTAWRFSPTGVLDPSFGQAGIFVFGSPGAAGGTGASLQDQSYALSIDCLGQMTVAGSSENQAAGIQLALWRLN